MTDKFEAWSFSFNKYVSYKTNLFNSMITFNAILISSLSIINVISNFSSPIILFLLFLSSFVPILLVIFLLNNLVDSSLIQSNALHPSAPKLKESINNGKNNTNNKKREWFIKFAQKSYIPWSIFNFICFISITTFGNHGVSNCIK